jgi:hypothetical protein
MQANKTGLLWRIQNAERIQWIRFGYGPINREGIPNVADLGSQTINNFRRMNEQKYFNQIKTDANELEVK